MKLLSNINASKWATKVEKCAGRGIIYLVFCKIASLIYTSEVISTLAIREGQSEPDEDSDVYFDISCLDLMLVSKEDYCCDMMLYNRWVNGHSLVFYPSSSDQMKTFSRITLFIGWLFKEVDVLNAIGRAKRIHPALYLDSKAQMKVQEKLEKFDFLYNAHYPLLHHKLIHPYIFKVL